MDEKYEDPVCGMEITTEEAPADLVEYEGETYYFWLTWLQGRIRSCPGTVCPTHSGKRQVEKFTRSDLPMAGQLCL